MSNELIELEDWEFQLADEEGKRFNAQATFSKKPSDDWYELFRKHIDLFFTNAKLTKKEGLKEVPQYSYSKPNFRLAVLDITEEDFEIIAPYILKTVKDMNETIYPEALKKKEDEKEKSIRREKKDLEIKKNREQELREKFNKGD